ncbi:MAG TPA: RiPP maturation radical SAM C-methyltransferase, partial [Candidatus Binatia bacterium]|nr:RiPP maturation radical SAM C-methyltransferase [Candidatus Binatia bacterium]
MPLAQGSVERDNLRSIPNILFRDSEDRVHQTPPLSKPINLDESPIPEYDDFFSDVAELKSHHQVEIEVQTLPVESSRGCWWGQISHCTFCGIDDETMKYRSKSPERVKLILSTLKARHGPRVFRFADYILPRQYYKTLLPELAQDPSKYFLHWEMKANVKCKDIEIMSLAGVVAVQPGIESFSTSVLKKMCKGVSGIQNVYTIKTLMEHNISVNYNILFGFPTDTPSEYRELINQIPYLYHLIAPYSYIPVQTTRFAPLQTDPERFGITKPIVSERAYDMILAPDYRRRIGFDLNNYCYIFETPYEFNPDCAELYNVLVYQVSHWIQLHESREPRLSYEVTESGIEYFDSRYDE